MEKQKERRKLRNRTWRSPYSLHTSEHWSDNRWTHHHTHHKLWFPHPLQPSLPHPCPLHFACWTPLSSDLASKSHGFSQLKKGWRGWFPIGSFQHNVVFKGNTSSSAKDKADTKTKRYVPQNTGSAVFRYKISIWRLLLWFEWTEWTIMDNYAWV